MRCLLLSIALCLTTIASKAKEIKDTLYTNMGDQIIVSYDISSDRDRVTVKISKPRIIPTESLLKTCKGNLDKLKAVAFDRVGDYGRIKWRGLSPSAFMIPSGISYDRSDEGFYIFGESQPIVFNLTNAENKDIKIPVFLALYEKKQNYKIIGSSTQPMVISVGGKALNKNRKVQTGTEVDQIIVSSNRESEAENDEIARALNSIQLIRQLLEGENELPFSQTLIMEMTNLRSIQARVTDTEILSIINNTILEFNRKEQKLKELQKEASLSAQIQEQALLAQQKIEEEERQKEAEEKARIQEEKQQKRTIWMIIGGVILAVCGFIGNALFKNFRDAKNQKSIMEMQANLAKQAQHEATRRSREIVRNKAHQLANKGKNKMREATQSSNKPKINTKRKSI